PKSSWPSRLPVSSDSSILIPRGRELSSIRNSLARFSERMNRPPFFASSARRAQFRLEHKMNISNWIRSSLVGMLSVATLMLAGSALATDHLSGRVLGGGAPVANSTVTLWEASSNAPKKLAETKTNGQGQFELRSAPAGGADSVLYLVATGGVPKAQQGDNPAIT